MKASPICSAVVATDTNRYLSEDYAFCRRWRDIGGKIWVDLRYKLLHLGRHNFRGDLAESLRLQNRWSDIASCVPGAELGAIESHNTGSDVHESCHAMLALGLPYTHSVCGNQAIGSATSRSERRSNQTPTPI